MRKAQAVKGDGSIGEVLGQRVLGPHWGRESAYIPHAVQLARV